MINLFKGTVVAIDDKTKTGIIKCRVNGLYNSDSIGNISDEDLPNVYPMYSSNLNDFDTPKIGEEVFIILDKSDKYMPFWVSKYNLSDEFKSLMSDDYEGFKSIKFDEEEKLRCYYSRKKGLQLELDKASVKIKDNEIKLITPDRTIHVKDGMISLGSENKSAEPSVLGDKNADSLNEILDEMAQIITAISTYATTQSAICKSVVILAPLSAGYDAMLSQLVNVQTKIAKTKAISVPKTKSRKTSLD